MSNMFIINPIDHQSHNIFSKEGKNILKKYVKMIQFGNAYSITQEKQEEDEQNGVEVFDDDKLNDFVLSYTEDGLISDDDTLSGMYMYVVSPKNELYLHEQVIGRIHHSSFGFEKVNGAGMMFINDKGKITAIDNLSGHYKPPQKSLGNVINALTKIGYDSTGIRFGWVNKSNTVISKLDVSYTLEEPPSGGFMVFDGNSYVLKNNNETILYYFKQEVEFPITFEKLKIYINLAENKSDFSEENTLSGDPFSGESFPEDPFPGDPFSGDPFSGESVPEDPFSGDPFSGESVPEDPFSGDPFSGESVPEDPFPGGVSEIPRALTTKQQRTEQNHIDRKNRRYKP
jgi:hypothetical protein